MDVEQQRSRSELKAAKSKFGRSKSSDLLKKESVALPYDKGKSTLTRLNSLKQWGRNRFKFMQRNAGSGSGAGDLHNVSMLSTINSSGCSNDLNSSGSSAHNSSIEKAEVGSASGSASVSSQKTSSTAKMGEKSGTDVDEDCRVHEYVTKRAHESRFSHERKPSYSSSEKSMSVSSSGHLRGKLHLNSVCANVKLRDTSSLNRQRRINGLGGSKDDQPHSSSGNWSASSESGRASIGSEITLQPKSSASNTSLNVSSFQNGSSAPPSSMLSRRRFFNTSASSSVTSEGTATPDLQMTTEGAYPNHLDDETSSAYSCDTEGYYTSFHMDSGLRTLKEEEINMSNFQIGGHSLNTSLFGQHQSSFNNSPQTLMAENEYELFGRGSTSTTTSSAGTVCTTLLAHNSGAEQSSLNNSLASCGPEVPERVSSLRLSSASTSTLERSISSSTIGSTLERTGTIKRNVNATLKLSCNDIPLDNMQCSTETPESQEEEFNFNEQIKKRSALPLPNSSNEIEVSESSDLEGVERIERIKQKTAINARRIPSMCIITPSTSDDENHHLDEYNVCRPEEVDEEDDLNKTLTEESFKDLDDNVKRELSQPGLDNLNHVKSSENLSFMDKLRVVLPSVKKSPRKAFPPAELSVINDDELYDLAGEYVYISADVSNNNNKKAFNGQQSQAKASTSSSMGIYYSNNVLRRPQATEYVSLNELPKTIQKAYVKESSSTRSTPAEPRATTKKEGSLFYEREGLDKQRNPQCADSEMDKVAAAAAATTQNNSRTTTTNTSSVAVVPMYAEINELRSEIAASATTAASSSAADTLSYLQNTPPSSASSSPHVSPHKGARVRLNAQGKPIYDSDSLKRRKGAHTTFAPGPYVKQQHDDNNDITSSEHHRSHQEENESVDTTTLGNATNATHSSTTSVKSESVISPVAKLLLLNKSNANPRKIANVRPIINHKSQSPLTRPLPLTPVEQSTANNAITSATDMSGSYLATSTYAAIYSDAKQLTANQTNPYFHQQSMMHSPSTKSTASSTGSTISSSTGSSSSASASASTANTAHSGGSGSSKDDEGKLSSTISIPTSTLPPIPQPPISITEPNPTNHVNNLQRIINRKHIMPPASLSHVVLTSSIGPEELNPLQLGTFKRSIKSSIHKETESCTGESQKSVSFLLHPMVEENVPIAIAITPQTSTPPVSKTVPPPPLPVRTNKDKMNVKSSAFPHQTMERNTESTFIENNDDYTDKNKEKSIPHNDDPKTKIQDTTNAIANPPPMTTTNATAATQLNSSPNEFAKPSPLTNTTETKAPSDKHMPLKRNNSYRLANDDMKVEMNKENHTLDNSFRSPSPHHFKSLPRTKIKSVLQNVLDDSQKSPMSTSLASQNHPNSSSTPQNSSNPRKIAKSFERLIDEFSLSTISVDSSYLRNKSLENFDDSPSILSDCSIKANAQGNGADEDSDSDLESLISPIVPQVKYHKSFIEAVLMKPLKIIVPNEDNRRQRILQKFEVTEIW